MTLNRHGEFIHNFFNASRLMLVCIDRISSVDEQYKTFSALQRLAVSCQSDKHMSSHI